MVTEWWPAVTQGGQVETESGSPYEEVDLAAREGYGRGDISRGVCPLEFACARYMECRSQLGLS